MKADEVLAFKVLFDSCDVDGTGVIPLKEFRSRLMVRNT